MLLKKKLLQFFYNALLTGMPSLTYNPYNKNILHAPFTVNKDSTYINYKLNENHIHAINDYMREKNNNDFELIKTKLVKSEINYYYNKELYIIDNEKDYYLSINIYNCSSPVFNFISEEPVTRCELNVYVVNKNDEQGTMILDYASNILSLDPEKVFRKAGDANFKIINSKTFGNVNSENFILNFSYNNCNPIIYKKLSDELILLSDKIYYSNGYYDKLYFDSSLLNNNIIKCNDYNVKFKFLNIEFEEKDIDSVFYFSDQINFVGGMWENIFTKV